MKSGIYIITNTKTQKVYVGSSVNLNHRKSKHFWMLRKGIHDNDYLQNSFNKFGSSFFTFNILEFCDPNLLIERENYYINQYKSNDMNFGFNLATVNEFRRNILNDEVKVKLSKYNLKKNGSISSFKLININTNTTLIFDNLFDAARYLINEGFSQGSEKNIRQKLSSALRGKKLHNGHNGSIRKTIYKHYFELINQ